MSSLNHQFYFGLHLLNSYAYVTTLLYHSQRYTLGYKSTMSNVCYFSVLALPILPLTFRLEVPLLGLEYRPWRLLLQVICFPGILGSIFIVFLKESPKFLLCKNKDEESLNVLKLIYSSNSGMAKENYPVGSLSSFSSEYRVIYLHKM